MHDNKQSLELYQFNNSYFSKELDKAFRRSYVHLANIIGDQIALLEMKYLCLNRNSDTLPTKLFQKTDRLANKIDNILKLYYMRSCRDINKVLQENNSDIEESEIFEKSNQN